MKIGEIEVFLNYGHLVIGSAGDPNFDLLVSDPPMSDTNHVILVTRAQIAPVRIGVWRGVAPKPSRQIFTGDVQLATGYVTLRESSEPPFFTWPATSAGARVTLSIGADAWEPATDITVVVDPDTDSMPDTASRSTFVDSVAAIGSLAQIDRALNGYNYPLDRLAAAMRILMHASHEGVSDARIRYGIASVTEWLKWLHPAISIELIESVSEVIRNDLRGGAVPGEAEAHALIANISSALGISADEFLMAR